MTTRESLRDIRNYLAGQHIGATRDEALLEEVLKCIFASQYMGASEERQERSPALIDPLEAAKGIRRAFRQVVLRYPDLFDAESEILLGSDDLLWVMQRLSSQATSRSDSDLIGDAYEAFIGSALRGQDGQFFTPRNAIRFLVEAVDPRPGETVIDPACGTGGFLAAIMLRHAQSRWDGVGLHGIDKDAFLVRLARVHVALAGGDYHGIATSDSIALRSPDEYRELGLPCEGEYDVVLTNPPFGARITSARPSVAEDYALARRWSYDAVSDRWTELGGIRKRLPPQLLFLEKCIRLLRPGGRCGMVVPESLLSGTQYRFAVAHLLRNAGVKVVAGMPEALFKTSGKGGTHTKTCLLVFEKNESGRDRKGEIFFAEARWCGNDSRGRRIPKDDLGEILKRYRNCSRDEASEAERAMLGFYVPTQDIEDYSLSPRRYDPSIGKYLDSLQGTHRIVRLGDLVERGLLKITTGDEVGKLSYGSGTIPFVRTSDISNWEIKSDPKHGVSEELYASLQQKQDVRPGDILMVKDGTYLIGTCALVTRYDSKMLFQSHLYKIRVTPETDDLNPYLLLAVISSRVVQDQIRAKRVTHDIIDSLGARVLELRLPIPSDPEQRNRITEQVRAAVESRAEARRLLVEAHEMVLSTASQSS